MTEGDVRRLADVAASRVPKHLRWIRGRVHATVLQEGLRLLPRRAPAPVPPSESELHDPAWWA